VPAVPEGGAVSRSTGARSDTRRDADAGRDRRLKGSEKKNGCRIKDVVADLLQRPG
jgi:hypothetical protein